MIGIKNIGCYIASDRVSNLEKAAKHAVTHDFITEKVGIASVARKKPAETGAVCLQRDELVDILVEATACCAGPAR